jgi:hypothetical protein
MDIDALKGRELKRSAAGQLAQGQLQPSIGLLVPMPAWVPLPRLDVSLGPAHMRRSRRMPRPVLHFERAVSAPAVALARSQPAIPSATSTKRTPYPLARLSLSEVETFLIPQIFHNQSRDGRRSDALATL